MAANASKFVYEIQAAYTGQSSIQRLQRDLDALGRARGYQEAVDNSAELVEALEAADAQVQALNASLAAAPGDSALVEALEAAVAQQSALQQQMEQSFDTVNAAAGAMNEYGLALEDVEGQIGALEHMVQQAGTTIAAQNVLGLPDPQDVQNQIQALQQAYQTLQNTPGISSSQLAQAHLNMLQQTQQLEQSTHNWSDALAQARGQILALAAAFAAVGKGVQMAIEFESDMAEVRKTVGGTREEIAALGNEIRAMSLDLPFGPGELAQIAAIGGQLGVAREGIADFVKIAATMGTAFDMAAEEAGDAIAKLGNVFQIPIDEVARLGDAINQLGNNTAARERDIINVMLRIGGTSRQFGLAEKNAAALAATMLSLGRAPEVAATSINALLNRLQIANTKPAIAQALERVGISAQDMARKIEREPQKALDDLLEALSKIEGVERAEVLTNLFGQGFQDEIGALVGGLDTYRKSLELVADETQYAGAMQREFADRSDTTANQLRLFANTIRDIWTTVGEGFRQALAPIAGWLTEYLLKPFADFIRESPKMAAFTVGVVGLTAAARPLETLFASLNVAVRSCWASFVGMGSASTVGGLALLRQEITLANIQAMGLRGTLTSIGAVLASFAAGWWVGEWLNQFDVVRKAGVALVAGLHKSFLVVRESLAWWTGGYEAADAVRRELDQVDEIYGEMFAEIERGTDEYRQKQQQAQKEITESAKVANAEQVADAQQAAREMAQAYKRYVDEVRRLQGEIVNRERSLTAELREMRRGGMNEADAWVDQLREAEEYEKAAKRAADEARRAFAAGDTVTATAKWQEAVQYADDARNAYKALNREVKIGDQVVVSAQTALKASMNGVRDAGKLAIDFLKEQEKAAADAAAALEKTHGIEALTADMDAAEKKWVEGWRKIRGEVEETGQAVQEIWRNAAGFWTNTEDAFSAGFSRGAAEFTANWNESYARFEREGKNAAAEVERAIDRAAKDRTTTIRIRTLETRRWGGLIGGAAQRFAAGGKLPGYGGGDRVSALLEAGEFVVRKEAVKKFGAGFFRMLNSLKLPPLPFVPDFSGLLSATAAVGGVGGSAPAMVLELRLPGGESVQTTVVGDDAEKLARWNRRVSNARYKR